MSFVLVSPDAVSSAAASLDGIGSAISGANAAAAGPTTTVLAAAEDEVSAAIAQLFGTHAREFQAISAQAAAFHAQFVQSLTGAGGAYALTEAASTSPLQTLEDDFLAVINAPTEFLFGRPLIGNGTNGAPDTGQAGGAGGILWGNGGSGGSGVAGTAVTPAGPGGA
ncbi:MAG: hypothetical protein JWP83_2494, partial [Mycobacterium sp.]|uniref:PE family protein n=1 Tax=Mycobacterium sp. TaxID=1785 RepID=UPI00262C1A74